MLQLIMEEDFQRHRASGLGYIYNDFSGSGASGVSYNILHLASCRTLLRANTNVDKYFAADLHEALTWLNAKRAQNWKRCPVCAP